MAQPYQLQHPPPNQWLNHQFDPADGLGPNGFIRRAHRPYDPMQLTPEMANALKNGTDWNPQQQNDLANVFHLVFSQLDELSLVSGGTMPDKFKTVGSIWHQLGMFTSDVLHDLDTHCTIPDNAYTPSRVGHYLLPRQAHNFNCYRQSNWVASADDTREQNHIIVNRAMKGMEWPHAFHPVHGQNGHRLHYQERTYLVNNDFARIFLFRVLAVVFKMVPSDGRIVAAKCFFEENNGRSKFDNEKNRGTHAHVVVVLNPLHPVQRNTVKRAFFRCLCTCSLGFCRESICHNRSYHHPHCFVYKRGGAWYPIFNNEGLMIQDRCAMRAFSWKGGYWIDKYLDNPGANTVRTLMRYDSVKANEFGEPNPIGFYEHKSMVFHTNATVAKSLNLSSGRVAAKVSNVAVQLFSILNRYNFKSTSLAVNDISKSTDIPAHIRDRDTEFLGNLMLHKASGVKLFLDSVATHMRCREDILTTVHKNAYSLIACLGDDAIKFANGSFVHHNFQKIKVNQPFSQLVTLVHNLIRTDWNSHIADCKSSSMIIYGQRNLGKSTFCKILELIMGKDIATPIPTPSHNVDNKFWVGASFNSATRVMLLENANLKWFRSHANLLEQWTDPLAHFHAEIKNGYVEVPQSPRAFIITSNDLNVGQSWLPNTVPMHHDDLGPQHDGLPGDFELPAEDYGLQVLPEEHAGQGGPVHHTIRSRLVFKDQQGDGVPLRVNNNLGLPQLMISQLNPAAAGPAAAAFASFSVDLTDPSNIPSIAIIIAGLALMRAGINVNSMPVRTHDVVSSIAQNAESSQAHAAAQAMANHQAALAALQNANNNDDDQDDQDDQDDDDDDDDDDEQP